mmetsp:Transcript_38711/g.82620  ORF Transcript_38711/g.82620 Transcript_38711/m.82620 type:complete len:241 (-) Transcript_38711:167-889(-)
MQLAPACSGIMQVTLVVSFSLSAGASCRRRTRGGAWRGVPGQRLVERLGAVHGVHHGAEGGVGRCLVHLHAGRDEGGDGRRVHLDRGEGEVLLRAGRRDRSYLFVGLGRRGRVGLRDRGSLGDRYDGCRLGDRHDGRRLGDRRSGSRHGACPRRRHHRLAQHRDHPLPLLGRSVFVRLEGRLDGGHGIGIHGGRDGWLSSRRRRHGIGRRRDENRTRRRRLNRLRRLRFGHGMHEGAHNA